MPTLDVDAALNRTLPCSGCGREHRVETRLAAIGADAIEVRLPAFLIDDLAARRPLVVWDDTTREKAGRRAQQALTGAGLDAGAACCLPPTSHGPPSCDEPTVAAAEAALRDAGADAAVAVGSGTVNDVTKAAAGRVGVPFVVVPTAASMNGYTSAIAAVLQAGVKCTVSFPPAAAVVADPEVVGAAPPEMTRAGLGDLLSKSVCGADWRVSHLLEGAWWCELPGELVTRAEDACLERAAAIGAGEPEAVATLLEALLLSGVSMAVAGSSAPASGGEHLFSHLIDMRRHVTGEPMTLHGAQVGVGTLASAALYEALLAYPVEREVDPDALAARHPTWEEEAARIGAAHGPLAEEVLGCYRDKHRPRAAQREHVAQVVARWPELREQVAAVARPLQVLRGALEASGAPVTARQLGLSPDEAREVFLLARDIRARYTVLDLAWDLGLLEELGERALEESGVLR